MNTFLPYKSFEKSAKALDNKRLGRQRVEAYQILKALFNKKKSGWSNHPAVLMWKGYEGALFEYLLAMITEWGDRGFSNEKMMANAADLVRWGIYEKTKVTDPPWLGSRKFHASHQSNLLRKDPAFYGRYNWKVGPDLPYVWPSKEPK